MTEPLTEMLRRYYEGEQFQPSPDFAQRISRALPSARSASVPLIRRRRLLLAAAALLATAAITAVPVAASTSPVAVFPRYLLGAAGLGPVVERIMPTAGRATSAGYTLDLVGTYADDARTIVVVKVSPGARVDAAFLIESSGRGVNQSGGTSNDETGDNVLRFEPVRRGGSGPVKVTLYVLQLGRGLGAGQQTVNGLWTLQFTLTSQGGRRLAAPDPGQAGTLAVTFDSVVVVPGALAIDVTTRGAMPDEWWARYGSVQCSTPAGAPAGVQACGSVPVPPGAVKDVVAVAVYDARGNALRASGGVGAAVRNKAALDRKEVYWKGLWTLAGPGSYRVVVRAPDGATLERLIQVP